MRRIPRADELRPLPESEAFALAKAAVKAPGSSRGELTMASNVGHGLVDEARDRSIKRRLAQAIEWGWLRREGASRGIVYFPTAEFRHAVALQHIAKPLSERPKQAYCMEVLQDYVPNVTFYLSDEQRSILHASCPPGSFNPKDPAQAGLMRRFMTDISHHSALLEGVRAKYMDTIQLLEDNIHAQHLSEEEAVILRNHYNAVRTMAGATGFPAGPRDFRVSERHIREIHALVSDGLLRDLRQQGRLRYGPVSISESQYQPLCIPDQIQHAFRLMVEKAAPIEDPFEQAFFLSAHIPYLQPFDDCNKRTARVACNIPLLNKGVLPFSWREVSGKDYMDALLELYECQSPFGLAKIFTDSYVRGVERFDIEQKQRKPSRHEVTYAREIERMVRAHVLEGHSQYVPSIPMEHLSYVQDYVAKVLASAKDNDMVLAPYRIDLDQWEDWVRRERDASSAQGAQGAPGALESLPLSTEDLDSFDDDVGGEAPRG